MSTDRDPLKHYTTLAAQAELINAAEWAQINLCGYAKLFREYGLNKVADMALSDASRIRDSIRTVRIGSAP